MPDGKPVAVGDAPIGGQAVLEGVMMRGVSTWSVACRTPEERIEVTSEPIVSWAKRHRILRLPVIRGVVALGESLKIGFKALAISANAQLADGEEEEEIGGFTWGLTIAFSLVLAIGLFFAPIGLPAWYWLVASRILGIPLIAGLSYEVIKWAGKHRNKRWVRAVMWPGLMLQNLTTREPDEDQLEVAIRALQAVLAVEDPYEAKRDQAIEIVA